MNPQLKLLSICRDNGLHLSDTQLAFLAQYAELLLDWNKRINLISRLDTENIWFNHILHSLSILFFVKIPESAVVLDLGTGGGLPGIPLAIARPDLKLTLLDSIKKKSAAVEDMIANLKINHVTVANGRAEELGRNPEFAAKYDVVIARAVAPLHELLKWSRPFLRRHRVGEGSAFLLAMKGGDLSEEIQTAKLKAKLGKHQVIDIVFKGSEVLSLLDKKIIVVPL